MPLFVSVAAPLSAKMPAFRHSKGNTMPPRFITLDGIDGAGKTTQLEVVRQWFERRSLPVRFTREPGGTALGEELRRILLNPATRASLHSETLLMFAARSQHLAEVVCPALEQGTSIVCDRFTDATFAYQGGGRGLDFGKIAELERWVQGSLKPDLTLILDVPLEVARERIESGRDKDRFELEYAAFFERTRAVYLQRAAAAPERYALIDSSRERAAVRAEIESVLDKLYGFA